MNVQGPFPCLNNDKIMFFPYTLSYWKIPKLNFKEYLSQNYAWHGQISENQFHDGYKL